MRSEILRTEEVVKSFGGVKALKGVSISVKEGSITMMIGPNGSGKTTLINVISGLYKPDSGKVFFNGREITGLSPHEIYRLGLVRTFQIPQPFTKLTVLENLLVVYPNNPGEKFLGALRRDKWRRIEEKVVEKAFRILKLLKLDHLWDQQSYKLSGGQMKLLEVGRALMSDAKLIMMDEPAAGVNPVLAHEIFRKFRELKDKLGVTFFLIEHRLEIALRYTDYVYAMANGVLVAEGVPETVMVDPQVIEAYLGG
ncbi:MAG TPA: ABC transporter ATP-binding protein [Nitrososphaeria archaeon]|nr:ABC transporter ATP-binding protein [Nitrososphaeria archaeon]